MNYNVWGGTLNRTASAIIFIAIGFTLTGCGTKTTNEETLNQENKPTTTDIPVKEDPRPLLVAFGDSLTEGAGVDPAQNYPSKLQARIDAAGYSYRVVNAGVSGETSSQGLSRAEAIAAQNPAIVIVEFGANDGLRGVPVETTRQNLEGIIVRLQSAGAKVILAGMEVPPNYGPQYTRAFREIFSSLSKERQIPLIPFFLQGVGGHPELNQDDGIHPTAEGYDIVVETVWKVLEPLL
ncbi:MAG: arylesterase [Acidobacteria bacterium]|nr:arylesterase [Acidobacteriota bacterium]